MVARLPRSARLFDLALALGVAGLVSLLLAAPDRARGDEPRSASMQSEVGLRAPHCELASLSPEGEFLPPRERDFAGRIVLVDFWASWCPTCEHAFPFLNALAREYRGRGLEVIAVNVDADSADALGFLAGRAVDFEIARDASGRCPRAFGLVGMPSSYLIDGDGRVLAVTRGFRAGEARSLRERIETLLVDAPGGGSDPALARVSSPPPP